MSSLRREKLLASHLLKLCRARHDCDRLRGKSHDEDVYGHQQHVLFCVSIGHGRWPKPAPAYDCQWNTAVRVMRLLPWYLAWVLERTVPFPHVNIFELDDECPRSRSTHLKISKCVQTSTHHVVPSNWAQCSPSAVHPPMSGSSLCASLSYLIEAVAAVTIDVEVYLRKKISWCLAQPQTAKDSRCEVGGGNWCLDADLCR